jgi:hypothetical protein
MEIGQLLSTIVKNNQEIFIRYGVVTARTATNTRISVQISGAATAVTGIRYLSSYTPTVADVVVCLVNDNDVIVLGKLT